MAKLGFKDIIMKYLKKDEAFKVKYAMNPNQKIAVATYNDRADAEKFVSDIIKKSGKAILTQEKHIQHWKAIPIEHGKFLAIVE